MKRVGSAVLVLTVLAMLVASCAPAATPTPQVITKVQTQVVTKVETQVVEKVITATPPPKGKVVRLAFIVNVADHPYIQALINAFKAEAAPRPLAIVGGTLVDVSEFGRSNRDVRDAVIIVRDGRIQGFNLLVGGGLGMTHHKGDTAARLAEPLGFVPSEHAVEAVRLVAAIFRDHGNRSDRRHARLKYLLAEWGTPEGGFILSDYGDGEAIGVPLEKKQVMLDAFVRADPWRKR